MSPFTFSYRLIVRMSKSKGSKCSWYPKSMKSNETSIEHSLKYLLPFRESDDSRTGVVCVIIELSQKGISHKEVKKRRLSGREHLTGGERKGDRIGGTTE